MRCIAKATGRALGHPSRLTLAGRFRVFFHFVLPRTRAIFGSISCSSLITQAAVGVEVDLSDLVFTLTQAQLKDISRLVAVVIQTGDAIRRREVSLMLKDRVERPALMDARARWRYAIERVILEVTWRKGWGLFSPAYFAERSTWYRTREAAELGTCFYYLLLLSGTPGKRRLLWGGG